MAFRRAEVSSVQIRNNHAAISRLAVVKGLFVTTSNPEKNDWVMPIYSTGSMFTIEYIVIFIKYNENVPNIRYPLLEGFAASKGNDDPERDI